MRMWYNFLVCLVGWLVSSALRADGWLFLLIGILWSIFFALMMKFLSYYFEERK